MQTCLCNLQHYRLILTWLSQKEKPEHFQWAMDVEEELKKEDGVLRRFQKLAKELQVVLPVSIYEKKNNARYVIHIEFKCNHQKKKSTRIPLTREFLWRIFRTQYFLRNEYSKKYSQLKTVK